MKEGQGCVQGEAFLPREEHVQRRDRVQYVLGAVSSSTCLKNEMGRGVRRVGRGLVEVPVEAGRQERPDQQDLSCRLCQAA